MDIAEFHTDLKAAYGKAKIHLVETKTEKRLGHIDLSDGNILCESDEHKDILVALLREKYSALVGEIIGDLLIEDGPEPEPEESAVDLSGLSPLPGGTLKESIFHDDRVQKGLIGEQRTAGVLSVLLNDPGTRILHSLNLSTRDIDHIFFARHGIFVINTKYRRSTDRVLYDFKNSWSQKIIDDTREVAQVTSRFLMDTGIPLDDIYRPRVVLWTEPSFEVDITRADNGVELVPGDKLVEHIMGTEQVISADTCIAMYEMLRLQQRNLLA